MTQVLTVSCKLEVSPEQAKKLDAVLTNFAKCCEFVNSETPTKLTNQIAVQSLIYKAAREYSGLSSQLTILAIRRVCGNRKTAKQKNRPVRKFSPTSANYDSRTFTFNESKWQVSLTMMKGREKFPLSIGNYQRHLLTGQKPKSAALVKKKSGDYYLQIQLHSEPPRVKETEKCLGVDLGRRDIAVSSVGHSFSGESITKVRDKYSRVRQSVQKKADATPRRLTAQGNAHQVASKGTRSREATSPHAPDFKSGERRSSRRRCRQLLARLSGRERRFQSWQNHTVSYRLVQYAKTHNQFISLEDLTGIRERTNEKPRSKTERRRSNSWAFYQLRQFLEYKCIKEGVGLVLVNPAYSSQVCHKCLHIHPVKGKSYRSGKNFKCGHCGNICDADLNGAKNIEQLGRSVNTPGGSSYLRCDLSYDSSGPLKAHVSA